MKLTKIKEVEQWATERGLYESGDSLTQYCKLVEEIGELARAVIKSNLHEKIDAIGDCVVVLINYCKMSNINIENIVKKTELLQINFELLFTSLDEKNLIKMLIMSLRDFYVEGLEICSISAMLTQLSSIAIKNDTTLEACLDAAYFVIKNRTGKMENGSFIKNEE